MVGCGAFLLAPSSTSLTRDAGGGGDSFNCGSAMRVCHASLLRRIALEKRYRNHQSRGSALTKRNMALTYATGCCRASLMSVATTPVGNHTVDSVGHSGRPPRAPSSEPLAPRSELCCCEGVAAPEPSMVITPQVQEAGQEDGWATMRCHGGAPFPRCQDPCLIVWPGPTRLDRLLWCAKKAITIQLWPLGTIDVEKSIKGVVKKLGSRNR